MLVKPCVAGSSPAVSFRSGGRVAQLVEQRILAWPICSSGGIGRPNSPRHLKLYAKLNRCGSGVTGSRPGLKIQCELSSVGVRIPSPAPNYLTKVYNGNLSIMRATT